MIDVTYKTLYESSCELMKQRSVINYQAQRISSVITMLSKYTDFDVQLKRLYTLMKKFNDEAYTVFCMGRALELCAKEYEKTEANVEKMLDAYEQRKNTVAVSAHRYLPNPPFISIV